MIHQKSSSSGSLK